MKKRVLSLLLIIAIVIGVFPLGGISVLAEDGTGATDSGKVALPYFFDFESDFIAAGWQNIDADGDGNDWITGTNKFNGSKLGMNGSLCAISQSYENEIGAYDADNWLFSPAIAIPAEGAEISWYEQSQDSRYLDNYTVYIGETVTASVYDEITNPTGMKVLCANHQAANFWKQISVVLSGEEYGGKNVYIAFRHEANDCYLLEIDNFSAKSIHTITNARPQSDAGTNHGYLSVDQTLAVVGKTVTITVTREEGYELKAGTLKATYYDDKESGSKELSLIQDENNKTKYSFKMPEYPVNITADFQIHSAHYFTGDAIDNGDGTHSRKCTECSEYGQRESHNFVDGVCTVCKAERKYIDRSWDETNKQVVSTEKPIPDNVQKITADTKELSSGWYILSESVTLPNGNNITINGDVNLILCDDCELKIPAPDIKCAGIELTDKIVGANDSFTVYGQKKGTGSIIVYGGSSAAGIGSITDEDSGNITINGGIITAYGGTNAAGIGGGPEGDCGDITINGGTIMAHGGYKGAGIGNGLEGKGGSITINGGTIKAYGDNSMAIGGDSSTLYKNNIYLNGGNILADSTSNTDAIIAYSINVYLDTTTEKCKAFTIKDFSDNDINGSPVREQKNIKDILSGKKQIKIKLDCVHTYTGECVDNKDGTHSEKCSVCGAVSRVKIMHDFSNGYKNFGNGTHNISCKQCGNTIPATRHTIVEGKYKDNGYTHSEYCAVCGFVNPTVHTYVNYVCICGKIDLYSARNDAIDEISAVSTDSTESIMQTAADKINNATTLEKITALKEKAIAAIIEADELAVLKKVSIKAINDASTDVNETIAEKAITNINKATAKEQVIALKEAALGDMAKADELDAAKKAAVEEITYISTYDSDAIANVAITNINKASTKEQVIALKEAAIVNIGAVERLASVANAAIDEITDEKTDVNESVAQSAIEQIRLATTLDKIIALKTEALAAMAAADALPGIKEDAIIEINNARTTANALVAQEGIKKIQAAVNATQVAAIKQTTLDTMAQVDALSEYKSVAIEKINKATIDANESVASEAIEMINCALTEAQIDSITEEMLDYMSADDPLAVAKQAATQIINDNTTLFNSEDVDGFLGYIKNADSICEVIKYREQSLIQMEVYEALNKNSLILYALITEENKDVANAAGNAMAHIANALLDDLDDDYNYLLVDKTDISDCIAAANAVFKQALSDMEVLEPLIRQKAAVIEDLIDVLTIENVDFMKDCLKIISKANTADDVARSKQNCLALLDFATVILNVYSTIDAAVNDSNSYIAENALKEIEHRVISLWDNIFEENVLIDEEQLSKAKTTINAIKEKALADMAAAEKVAAIANAAIAEIRDAITSINGSVAQEAINQIRLATTEEQIILLKATALVAMAEADELDAAKIDAIAIIEAVKTEANKSVAEKGIKEIQAAVNTTEVTAYKEATLAAITKANELDAAKTAAIIEINNARTTANGPVAQKGINEIQAAVNATQITVRKEATLAVMNEADSLAEIKEAAIAQINTATTADNAFAAQVAINKINSAFTEAQINAIKAEMLAYMATDDPMSAAKEEAKQAISAKIMPFNFSQAKEYIGYIEATDDFNNVFYFREVGLIQMYISKNDAKMHLVLQALRTEMNKRIVSEVSAGIGDLTKVVINDAKANYMLIDETTLSIYITNINALFSRALADMKAIDVLIPYKVESLNNLFDVVTTDNYGNLKYCFWSISMANTESEVDNALAICKVYMDLVDYVKKAYNILETEKTADNAAVVDEALLKIEEYEITVVDELLDKSILLDEEDVKEFKATIDGIKTKALTDMAEADELAENKGSAIDDILAALSVINHFVAEDAIIQIQSATTSEQVAELKETLLTALAAADALPGIKDAAIAEINEKKTDVNASIAEKGIEKIQAAVNETQVTELKETTLTAMAAADALPGIKDAAIAEITKKITTANGPVAQKGIKKIQMAADAEQVTGHKEATLAAMADVDSLAEIKENAIAEITAAKTEANASVAEDAINLISRAFTKAQIDSITAEMLVYMVANNPLAVAKETATQIISANKKPFQLGNEEVVINKIKSAESVGDVVEFREAGLIKLEVIEYYNRTYETLRALKTEENKNIVEEASGAIKDIKDALITDINDNYLLINENDISNYKIAVNAVFTQTLEDMEDIDSLIPNKVDALNDVFEEATIDNVKSFGDCYHLISTAKTTDEVENALAVCKAYIDIVNYLSNVYNTLETNRTETTADIVDRAYTIFASLNPKFVDKMLEECVLPDEKQMEALKASINDVLEATLADMREAEALLDLKVAAIAQINSKTTYANESVAQDAIHLISLALTEAQLEAVMEEMLAYMAMDDPLTVAKEKAEKTISDKMTLFNYDNLDEVLCSIESAERVGEVIQLRELGLIQSVIVNDIVKIHFILTCLTTEENEEIAKDAANAIDRLTKLLMLDAENNYMLIDEKTVGYYKTAVNVAFEQALSDMEILNPLIRLKAAAIEDLIDITTFENFQGFEDCATIISKANTDDEVSKCREISFLYMDSIDCVVNAYETLDAAKTEKNFQIASKAEKEIETLILMLRDEMMIDPMQIDEERADEFITTVDSIKAKALIDMKTADYYSGMSLTLNSDIYINFYMDLTEAEKENGTMTFNIGGRIVTGVKAKYNETEKKYYFACSITALEMAETVTATFSYNDVDYIQTYSVERYIEEIVGNPGKYGDKAVMLAKKIANYGYYAQEYLASIHTNIKIVSVGSGYDRMIHFGNTETENFDINVEAATTALNNYSLTVNGASDALNLYGSTVYFDSATALNYYVKVTDGTEPTAVCEGKDIVITEYKGYTPTASEKVYIISVKGITATELDDNIVVKVNDKLTITGSVFAYCKAVMNKEGQTDVAKNAMAAFYEYHAAAVEYASTKG